MGSKVYQRGQLVLIVLLVIVAVLAGWALNTQRYHLSILLGIGILVLAVILYFRMIRINQEILYFFKALENDDTSIRYNTNHRNSLIDELHRHLNRVNENFQSIQLNNELREQYFSKVLEHISSGLVVFSKTGHVDQVNEEALRLLNLEQLTHVKVLSQAYPGLGFRIAMMRSLDRSELTIVDRETGIKKALGLQMVKITLKGEEVSLLTLQDLSAGLERKEIDDWIRLIRVMSHEIMNSLAPITSISTTLKEIWSGQESAGHGTTVSESTVQQTLKGLDAIAEQSEGLSTFFESYRVLSRIPDPVKKEFRIDQLYEKLETLVDHFREDKRITIGFECKVPELKLKADEQMITQVLLNLVKNANQALENVDQGNISVSADAAENRIILSVTDNGEGIPPENRDEIFMPFFTTRKKGTGVGLSYSRQVMAMNDGRMEFESRPGRTQFRLIF
jgi:nitrogen fixation/metabolism regulation signal transduction histidine kinase